MKKALRKTSRQYRGRRVFSLSISSDVLWDALVWVIVAASALDGIRRLLHP